MAKHPNAEANVANGLRRKQITIPAAASAASAISALLIASGVITAAELPQVSQVKLIPAAAFKVGDAADHDGLSLTEYTSDDPYEEPISGEALQTEFAKASSGAATTAEARVYFNRF